MRRTREHGRRIGVRRLFGPALALAIVVGAGGADRPSNLQRAAEGAAVQASRVMARGHAWYRRTPPADRVTWGGLGACALLGIGAIAERTLRLRRGRVLPTRFVDRFRDRVRDGHLEPGKATDLCELNPSPASRVALAAIRRWGQPASEIERSVARARQVEVDLLGRNVGTLRRIAALSPLIGLLGTLLAAGRTLSGLGTPEASAMWGPALAGALSPLTAGVALAILALIAFDGLTGRVERLGGSLDLLGAEAVDAVSAAPTPSAATRPSPTPPGLRGIAHGPHPGMAGPARGSSPIRIEIPDALKDY